MLHKEKELDKSTTGYQKYHDDYGGVKGERLLTNTWC